MGVPRMIQDQPQCVLRGLGSRWLGLPGHTPGHVSVIVMAGNVCYFLAGDATYTQQALVQGQVDGVSPSEAVSLRTMQTIVRLARERPTVYLPTHDPGSVDRLALGATVRLNEPAPV